MSTELQKEGTHESRYYKGATLHKDRDRQLESLCHTQIIETTSSSSNKATEQPQQYAPKE